MTISASLCLILGGWLTCASHLQALDFRLQKLHNEAAEGNSIDYYFNDDELRIFYRPPVLWTSQGTAGEFVARAPYPSEGRLMLRGITPVKTLPTPGTKEGLNAFRTHFAQNLPEGAIAVRALEIECDTVGGRELPATRATFSYELKGNPRLQTLIYVGYRPDLWIEIRIESHKEDFLRVKSAGLLSLEAFTEEARATANTAAN